MDFANFILGRQQLIRWTMLNHLECINTCSIQERPKATSARRIFASVPPSSTFLSLQFNPSVPPTGPMSDDVGDGGPRPWPDGMEEDLCHRVVEKM
jgi:hypothetical protein